jgi:PTH1 family peptidyl-tRNA hydrolase
MKLIVGLGNPGPKYLLTRHNVGFLFIDMYARLRAENASFKSEFKAETLKIKIGDEHVILCKPQTFMNLSGESVQPLMKFYILSTDDLLVVHDEVDIPFANLKFQPKRGHGGHNGIRNIHQMLGTDNYGRLRLGVGRPPAGVPIETADWVLANFSKDEQTQLPDFLSTAIEGAELWVSKGLQAAATKFNLRGE